MILQWIARALLIVGLLLSTAIFAQGTTPVSGDMNSFSGNITGLSLGALVLLVVAKIAEWGLKWADMRRTAVEKSEVSKVMHDLVIMTAKCEGLQSENNRMKAELEECDGYKEKYMEKIDFYREKWHQADIRIAQLTGKQPPPDRDGEPK